MIYLDYAANTPTDEAVLQTFCDVTRRYIANPNAPHALGAEAGDCLMQSTRQILDLLRLKNAEVIYTSGASEANNLAIKGCAEKYKNRGKHVITTYLEHSSVNGAFEAIQNAGFEVEYVDIGPDGLVDLDHLRSLLRADTILVSICYVDSEIGLTQQVGQIRDLLSGYPNCRLHTDATQAIGKMPVDFDNIDLISFTPHKFYGLNGAGVLIKKEDVLLEPQIHGGISTTPYRSGTPALGLIAATAKALELAVPQTDARIAYVRDLNTTIRTALARYSKIKINSTEQSSPYILNISIPGVQTDLLRDELAKREIYLSTRSACCAPNTPSRPVYALTKDRKRAMSPLRVSLSHLTMTQEAEQFLEAFDACYDELTK